MAAVLGRGGAPEPEPAERPASTRSTRIAAIVLAVLLIGCATVFALLARDAGLGRGSGPAPAKVTPQPVRDAPGVRLVSDVTAR
ncbi:hypothetical protein [Actinomadura atramentaria]|uniref:hypothetical protein n=1 Tax=Actinomadura atramentaria TaxID=1990 RepID=UPI000366CA28|nr:hypothetical protein [Actinomadura atramentaria]